MPPSERALRRLLWGVLALALAGVAASGLHSILRGPLRTAPAGGTPARLPVYGAVPEFSLVERSGRSTRGADLQGKVWIANLMYTHCTDTCPLQSAEMAHLQEEFATDDLRLVSITVDPDRDTPAVLERYGRRFGADPVRWVFLTGEKQAILRLAVGGFRLPVEAAEAGRSPLDRAFPAEASGRAGAPAKRETLPAAASGGRSIGPSAPEVLHSSRFVLVDRRRRIRGYYESGDADALQRLRRDTRLLLREPFPAGSAAGEPRGQ